MHAKQGSGKQLPAAPLCVTGTSQNSLLFSDQVLRMQPELHLFGGFVYTESGCILNSTISSLQPCISMPTCAFTNRHLIA